MAEIKCNEGGPYPWDYPSLVTDQNPACLCEHAQFQHACDDGEWNECKAEGCQCREFRDVAFGSDDEKCYACGEELCEGQTCRAGSGGPAEYERWCSTKGCREYQATPREVLRFARANGTLKRYRDYDEYEED